MQRPVSRNEAADQTHGPRATRATLHGSGTCEVNWHWFNAEETAWDLLTLRGSDVLTVDLNHAGVNLSLDQYQDDHRELPASTGVIPVKDFLDALVQTGYNGPIQAEPFNAALRALSLDRDCARVPAP